jgi:hypothetical protein
LGGVCGVLIKVLCWGVQIVMDWLGKLLCLPTSFLAFDEQGKRGLGGGVIQVGHHLLNVLSSPFFLHNSTEDFALQPIRPYGRMSALPQPPPAVPGCSCQPFV